MNEEKTDNVDSVRLVDEQSFPIKSLDGFQKHHRVPTSDSPGDLRLIQEIVTPELDEDLQATFSALRKSYGLKRKQLSVDGPFEGEGIITTPFFRYQINAEQDTEDPGRVVFRRTINDIFEPARVFSGPFDEVFGHRFRCLQITTENGLDLESIVDHIEDSESETVSVDYDKDLTWCEVTVADTIITVIIRDHSIRVISRREIPPAELLESFVEIQRHFISNLKFDRFSFVV